MFKNSWKPDPSDFVIVIMGPSGSGKSNFINTLTGNTERHKAGGARSDTQNVIPYPIMDNGVRVVLVDTPGFDDTYRPDSEILKIIADWLTQKYPNGGTLNIAGILYFHRITDNRISGSTHKNLQIFGRLCGNLSLRRARLVTTMWDRVEHQRMAESREKQLMDDIWRKLIMEGAVARRFVNTSTCAWDIVHELTKCGDELSAMRDESELLIQEELVEQKKGLNETEAAKVLHFQSQRLLAEQRKALKELADEAKMQGDPALARRLQEEYNKIQAQLQKTFDEMDKMKTPFLRRLTLWLFGPKSRAQAVKLDDL